MTAAAAAASFNRISVDAQMSPSDTLLVMAGGGGPALAGADRDRFAAALAAVCRWLAIQMVKDGEGAEHAVRVVVRGARDDAEAERVARAVGESPLVKTADLRPRPQLGAHLPGGRPGPRRRRRGRSTSRASPWTASAFDSPAAAEVLARDEYDLEVALGRGDAGAELWVSDLGHAYVTINAEYHT